MAKVRWMADPQEHDFPAAAAYLGLLLDERDVDAIVAALRTAAPAHVKAKDILRAAGLPLLAPTNPHVASDLAKIRAKTPLSPILLVRGDARAGLPVLIADGYHRVCTSYHTDENTDIPVGIVDLPDAGAAGEG